MRLSLPLWRTIDERMGRGSSFFRKPSVVVYCGRKTGRGTLSIIFWRVGGRFVRTALDFIILVEHFIGIEVRAVAGRKTRRIFAGREPLDAKHQGGLHPMNFGR